MKPKTKTLKPKQSTCPSCGKPAGFVITVFMTHVKQKCQHCEQVYYMDYAQIDWEAVNGAVRT